MSEYTHSHKEDMRHDISHQLRTLKQSRLVKFRREGKTIFYALDDDHIFSILRQGMEHIQE